MQYAFYNYLYFCLFNLIEAKIFIGFDIRILIILFRLRFYSAYGICVKIEWVFYLGHKKERFIAIKIGKLSHLRG